MNDCLKSIFFGAYCSLRFGVLDVNYAIFSAYPGSELFDELRKTGNQMAIAIDEFGGIAGLVTIKGLLEEIVGSVGEEGSTPNTEYETIGTNIYRVDGGMDIDKANNLIGTKIPDGDYETIGGFIIHEIGRIPNQGEHIFSDIGQIVIIKASSRKIDKIQLYPRKND